MNRKQSLWERFVVAINAPFRVFIPLAGVVALLGVTQLSSDRPSAIANIEAAAVIFGVRELLKRSLASGPDGTTGA